MKNAKGIGEQNSPKLLMYKALLLCIPFYLQESHLLCCSILLPCKMRTVMLLYFPNQSVFGITLNWTFPLMSTNAFVAVSEIAGLSRGSKSLAASSSVSDEQ